MALGPTVNSAYGQAIAIEADQIERDLAQIIAQRQAIAASNDMVAPVPERFRQAVGAAKVRLNQAENAFTRADQQARLRIRQANPSEALQKVWYEQDTIAAHNEREAAKEALAQAELMLGEQVQYRRAYERLEAAAPARKAEAERQYLQTLDAIDREVLVAKSRCAT